MKLSRGVIPAAIAALMLAAGCKGVPDGVLTERRLAEVMADLQYADALVNDYGMRSNSLPMTDSMRSVILQSVLARHGVTQADYDSTLRWYGHHMVRYVEACELADSIISDSIRSVDRQMALARARRGGGADTVEVWPHSPAHLFSTRAGGEYLTFEVPKDSSWRKGDIYIWEMTPVNTRSPLQMRLVVEYADNRLTTEVLESAESTSQEALELTFQLDSNKVARRIYGFAHLPAEEGENAYVNNISLKRTRLDSEDYYHGRRMVRQIYGAPRMRR